ncbi:MAG TPA: type II secretion system major pseudopilin GspG [Armatimonadota bacterium]|nr:type II secretion system major pseudopilin GspG [Armatimonadota bacterium]
MSSCKRLARTGFTLIELMVVMVILVLLAALVLPRVMNRAEEARRKTSIIQMSGLRGALEQYQVDNSGKIPSSEQGLDALLHEPTSSPKPKRWRGPYLKDTDAVPTDGWGNEWNYISLENNRSYHLWSLGADGVEGGDDLDADINSWERSTWAEG